jgi:hypothetical protein
MDAGCRQRSCRTDSKGAVGYARSAADAGVLIDAIEVSSLVNIQVSIRSATADFCEVGA